MALGFETLEGEIEAVGDVASIGNNTLKVTNLLRLKVADGAFFCATSISCSALLTPYLSPGFRGKLYLARFQSGHYFIAGLRAEGGLLRCDVGPLYWRRSFPSWTTWIACAASIALPAVVWLALVGERFVLADAACIAAAILIMARLAAIWRLTKSRIGLPSANELMLRIMEDLAPVAATKEALSPAQAAACAGAPNARRNCARSAYPGACCGSRETLVSTVPGEGPGDDLCGSAEMRFVPP